MIASVRIRGLARLTNRLNALKNCAGLNAVLREAAENVLAGAKANLSKIDADGANTRSVATSLRIQPATDSTGYTVETFLADGAELEFGTQKQFETRWLGSALHAQREKIREMIRTYLRGLTK